MTDKEFKAELRILINTVRENLIELKEDDNSIICQTFVKKQEAMLDKLEQDYFHLPADMSFENIKKFDEDGNLINEGEKEMSITEQVKEGLLKIFNDLLKAFDKYVEIRENNELKDYEFDYANFTTSLCQIADRLLQIESDRKMINSLRGV